MMNALNILKFISNRSLLLGAGIASVLSLLLFTLPAQAPIAQKPTILAEHAQALLLNSPLPTPTSTWAIPPTPGIPPVPTAIPTPQVTAIPTKQVFQVLPIIWVINVEHKQPPTQVLNKETVFSMGGIDWSLDGKEVLYLSPEGSKDSYEFNSVQNLWAVNVEHGTVRQLTNDMFVVGYSILPNQPWLYLTAYHLYEPISDGKFVYDLWLLDPKNLRLRRLTAQQDLYAFRMSVDGEHLFVSDNNRSLQSFSLINGLKSPIKF